MIHSFSGSDQLFKGRKLVKVFSRSRRDLAAILPRSRRESRRDRGEIAARFWPPRFPYLSATSATGRDHGRDRGVILRRDRGEIMARYGKSRRPKTRRDLGEITARYGKSRWPKTRREISAGKYAARCCSEIAARYGNLGGQNAPRLRGDIAR